MLALCRLEKVKAENKISKEDKKNRCGKGVKQQVLQQAQELAQARHKIEVEQVWLAERLHDIQLVAKQRNKCAEDFFSKISCG